MMCLKSISGNIPKPEYKLDDRKSQRRPGGTCPCRSGTGHASVECTHTGSDLEKSGFYNKLILHLNVTFVT